jgi:hypothetical protein
MVRRAMKMMKLLCPLKTLDEQFRHDRRNLGAARDENNTAAIFYIKRRFLVHILHLLREVKQELWVKHYAKLGPVIRKFFTEASNLFLTHQEKALTKFLLKTEPVEDLPMAMTPMETEIMVFSPHRSLALQGMVVVGSERGNEYYLSGHTRYRFIPAEMTNFVSLYRQYELWHIMMQKTGIPPKFW